MIARVLTTNTEEVTKMQRLKKPGNRQKGVTLLELLIVVAIVALLTSIAYPSYMRFVINSKRTAATSALLQIADRQQQFFMDNKTYAADLVALGFGASPYIVADDGSPAAATDDDRVYSVTLSNVSTTTYTATAAPLLSQLSHDTECGSLTLTQAGVRGSSGGGDCW